MAPRLGRSRGGGELLLVESIRNRWVCGWTATPPGTEPRIPTPKRAFSERELEYFLNVDFVNHVALAAVLESDGRQLIAGGGRYIVSAPGRAEVAFAVDDPHQKLGIGTRLMRHLVIIARDAEIGELVAEVLPDNRPMLKVFERCELPMTTHHETGVVHVTLDLSGRRHLTTRPEE